MVQLSDGNSLFVVVYIYIYIYILSRGEESHDRDSSTKGPGGWVYS